MKEKDGEVEAVVIVVLLIVIGIEVNLFYIVTKSNTFLPLYYYYIYYINIGHNGNSRRDH